jgi:uncharacterized protein involved in exopolysaccharide biosynthesis
MPRSTQVVFLAAAGVLVAGGAAALRLFSAPPKYTGPSTEQIMATSRRLGDLPKAPEAEVLFAAATSP